MNVINVTFQQFTYLIEKNKCPLYNVHASGVFYFVIFCGFAIQKWGPSQNTIFGPSPAPFPNIHFVHSAKYLFFIILGLGQVKTIAGSSTAARAGQGAEHCGQGRLWGSSTAARAGQGPSVAARTGLHFQLFSTKLVYIQGQKGIFFIIP